MVFLRAGMYLPNSSSVLQFLSYSCLIQRDDLVVSVVVSVAEELDDNPWRGWYVGSTACIADTMVQEC